MPQQGVEPTTSWCAGRGSRHLTQLARAGQSFLIACIGTSIWVKARGIPSDGHGIRAMSCSNTPAVWPGRRQEECHHAGGRPLQVTRNRTTVTEAAAPGPRPVSATQRRACGQGIPHPFPEGTALLGSRAVALRLGQDRSPAQSSESRQRWPGGVTLTWPESWTLCLGAWTSAVQVTSGKPAPPGARGTTRCPAGAAGG